MKHFVTDVSVIVINYNTMEMTMSCIDSVFEKTQDVRFELVLVDNASTDGSKEVFSKDNRIKYIYSETNLGFGKANNLGVQIANGRNILFLNSDTLLMNNAIKTLSDFLDVNPRCGACGANLFDTNHEPALSFYRNMPSLSRDLYRKLSNTINRMKYGKNLCFNYSEHPIKVCQISGADLMIKKCLIDEIGCFDSRFFMYYEDTELCFRIMKHGYCIMSVPEAKIQHLCGKSDKLGIANTWRVESRDLYFKLTGRSKLYRKVDCFVKLLTFKLIKIKYSHNNEVKDVCGKCITICKRIMNG